MPSTSAVVLGARWHCTTHPQTRRPRPLRPRPTPHAQAPHRQQARAAAAAGRILIMICSRGAQRAVGRSRCCRFWLLGRKLGVAPLRYCRCCRHRRPPVHPPARQRSFRRRAAERFFSDASEPRCRSVRLRRRGTVPSAAPAPLAMVVGLGPVGTYDTEGRVWSVGVWAGGKRWDVGVARRSLRGFIFQEG